MIAAKTTMDVPMSRIVVLLLVAVGHVAGDGEGGGVQLGQPHSSVQHLTVENFDSALNDPANGLWFLKFYAPWCGHCKKMAPVLEKVAPQLEGKMAIGKVDCTTQRSLCSRFGVKGYPTLKFYRDGEFHDYHGGRDEAALEKLGQRLSARPVTVVQSYQEALDVLASQSPHGVAFVAMDAKAAAALKDNDDEDDDEAVEKVMNASPALQVFGQVARKMQAFAYFGLLPSNVAPQEVAKFGFTPAVSEEKDNDNDDKEAPTFFLAKVERDVSVAPKLYRGQVATQDVLQFVKENNVALVTQLGPQNFRAVGNLGRPMAIAALNEEDFPEASQALSKALGDYAKQHAEESNNAYTFCVMDGKRWSKFLLQFSIQSLPQLFVLNASSSMYWQDDALGIMGENVVNVAAFLQAVENGSVEQRKQNKNADKGVVQVVVDKFVDYLPFSAIAVVLLFVMVFVLCVPVEPTADEMAQYEQEVATEATETKKDK